MQAGASGPYVGRFAPSPTGPLHFGSLVAAVASYLEARIRGGSWLLRIEDIDPPREQQGATDRIVLALETYGFEWDGELIFQSASRADHDRYVDDLVARRLAYPCGCSRRELQHARRGPLGPIYPGTCRNGCDAAETAIRVRTTNEPIAFTDRLQGAQSSRLQEDSGDFVIRRKDGLIAYQLAVVVDDQLQGVTDIVRGIDLMDSTPRQIWLQQLLGFRTPRYMHVPVVVHPNGDKLSKLTGAREISLTNAPGTLVAALAALGQRPPSGLESAALHDIWRWARENWHSDVLRGVRSIPLEAP